MNYRTGVMLLAAVLVAGCTKTTGPIGTAPPTPDRVAELRAKITGEHPGAVVGVVTAVLPENSLVAIADVAVDEIRMGDVMSLIDADENTLAHGKVVRRLESSVHVKYESEVNARAPLTGDAAVRLPR